MLIPMLLIYTLVGGVCAKVEKARASGLSDSQIEDAARSRGVPENVIQWAKSHCKRP